MRSVNPLPGNPWPHDMQISVDDRPQPLGDLLWLREAHALSVVGDAPPLLADTPAPAERQISDDVRAEWAAAWPRVWESVLQHVGKEQDRQLFVQLRETPDGSDERAELLAQLVGPSWRDEFGGDAFDDESYAVWERRGFDAHVASRPRVLADSPERRDLEALIPAWRKGLTKIVTIPCRGRFTRTLSPTSILMTEETRADSSSYREALAAFDA